MVLIFTKLQTDKQDVIGVADFKTLSNKKKYQKNFAICHLILQIFLNTNKKKISENFCYLSFNITNIFFNYNHM